MELYNIVTDENEIKTYQERLQAIFSSKEYEPIECIAGFSGGSVKITALWSNHLRMWIAFRVSTLKTPKYWTAFGLEKPKAQSTVQITAEINFSLTGSGQIQGAFVKNEKGEIFIGHRGRFGDKRRVSPSDFLEKIKNQFQVVTVNNGKKIALVGKLEDHDLPERVRDFIREVSRMKEAR